MKQHQTFLPGDRIQVLLPLPLAGPYDYRVGRDQTLGVGDVVDVPLGPRTATGVVWGAGGREVADAKLKDTISKRMVPPMRPTMCKFIDWLAAYTLSAQGAVLRMALSAPGAFDPPMPKTGYTLADDLPAFRETKARRRVIDFLDHAPAHVACRHCPRSRLFKFGH